jgi:cytochrome d ubiquinol oxidase subunit II
METTWFVLVAMTLAAYVLTDGFDLGVGILHLFLSRKDEDRTRALAAIEPYWDGNEVWLIVAGGTLVLAFPTFYATAFSGFYLPLTLVLWLLIGRACAIELRHHSRLTVWTRFWDTIFGVSSLLLALCLGVALANVVRGVPFGPDGTFFEPLWSGPSDRERTGILDPYTLLAGVTTTAALALHGALWLASKTEGDLAARALGLARRLPVGVLVLAVILSLVTFRVQPHVLERFGDAPWGVVFPLLAVGGLAVAHVAARRGRQGRAFLGSNAFLAGMMGSAAFGLYPFVLPSSTEPTLGLTVAEAAASEEALRTGLWWWIPGILLVLLGQAFVYRLFRGKADHRESTY